MSRWSTKPLRIALMPGEGAIVRAGGTPAQRVFHSPERSAASLLPLLDEALAEPGWQQREVEVVLSQHFVRHVLTPAPGKALSRDEEQALVSASFHDIYNGEANRWRIQVISQPPRHGLLGAAMDESFLSALEALLTRHGMNEIAIRPLASLAVRHLPTRFSGWWALAEPGWLSLFGGAGGVWHHVSGQPVEPDWQAALPERLRLVSSDEALSLPSNIWVQSLAAPASAPIGTRERWHLLPHDAAVSGALALAGI